MTDANYTRLMCLIMFLIIGALAFANQINADALVFP